MRAFMRMVDRFCAKHPNFGIPNLMLYVVIGNAAVFLFGSMDTTGMFYYWLALNPASVLRGEVWRLVTFALIPEASGLWVIIFLYFFYYIGSSLEHAWGPGRFTLFFMSGVLFNILYAFVVYFLGWNVYVTASYIYMSMFFAFAALYPEQRVLLFFFIPIKIKWLALLDGAFFLYAVFVNPFPVNLLPLVAIANFLLFCGGDLFSALRPSSVRYRANTVNFRREAAKIRKEQNARPYRHKCAVCGRTDTDYPDLEFRYCSRCAGYHCFCEDHIANHVHFTE
ncbi:MAG: rhomboid family intramembrane serine protease [Eubacteriales bacterium]|nr:rhomboid family intramembrane serine protease [Eubacteriales bacterium]